MEQKFYICEHCGNIVAKVKNSGVPVMCCGEKMKEIVPGTINASKEKHVPVYKVENNRVIVSIGSENHPMVEEHFIEWAVLETSKGCQAKYLRANKKPNCEFAICEDEAKAMGGGLPK